MVKGFPGIFAVLALHEFKQLRAGDKARSKDLLHHRDIPRPADLY
jgi:hypothetical protein